MGDTGANVHIGTDSINKSSRIIQNVHISSITGANKFTGRCKQTFHLVEHNTTHTRPVTLPAIDSDAPQIPHDIVSIGRLLDSHESNSFGLNGPKGLTLRLHDDTGSAFTTAVYWSHGTAWLSARTNPIGQFDTANALTRSQRKLILSNKTTSHTVGKSRTCKRKLASLKSNPAPSNKQHNTHARLIRKYFPKDATSNSPSLATRALAKAISSITQTVKSSTGGQVNPKGIHLQRNVKHPLRLQNLKVDSIELDTAHRHTMCMSEQILLKAIPTWLRSYIKKGSKLSHCDCCSFTKSGPAGKLQAKLKVDTPLNHGDHVYLDFQYQSTPALGGITSALHAIDSSSKFVAASYAKTRLKEPTIAMITDVLDQMWIAGLPAPTIVFMDNDASVNTDLMGQLQKDRNFQFKPFPKDSPSKNGSIENFHKTINKMKRSAAHRCHEPPDWIWWMLDRHAVDIWNNYITHSDATCPPAELVTGRKSCPSHLHTFFAEARLSNVSRSKPNPHKGDDTRIRAYYVGCNQHGAYFFDPISGNIIYSSSSHYKIVDDLQTKRAIAAPELSKYRTVPQLFSKPSFNIPAKTNALSAGLITSHDISPEESRTTSSKRVRQSQKDMLNKAKQALLNIKKGKKARKLPCPNNGIGDTLAQITSHNKVAQHFKRAGPKSRSTEIKGTSDIVGWTIQVAFDDGIFPGIIESYDPKDNLYTIKYGDNDIEQLWPSEITRCIITPPITSALNTDALLSKSNTCNFLREVRRSRSAQQGTVNFMNLDSLRKRAVQSIQTRPSSRARQRKRHVNHATHKLNKRVRKLVHPNRPEKRVSFSKLLHTFMPFRSAHSVKSTYHNDTLDESPTDNDANITELVNALRETNKVKLDFDVRHNSASHDKETNDMDHVFTLNLVEQDGHIVVNRHEQPQFDMSDTPKLRNVLNPDHPLHDMWCKGILTELIGLQVNKILRPISIDNLTHEERRHLLPSQIILKMKRSSDEARTPVRAKARWVVGGHRAVSKTDSESDYYHYDEVSAKGCNSATLRLLSVLSTKLRKLLHATDIKQAFTTAPLDQENPNRVFIRLPKALETRDSRGVPIVVLLLKNVYGMPNAGYLFAQALDNHLVDIGFEPSRGDHNLHRRFNANNEIQLYASYIDDGTALFPNDAEYQTFLKELQTKQKNGQTFELGLAQVQTETLGCQVIQASYNAPVGKPDEPGHVPSYQVDVEEGENYTLLFQPGLTTEILQLSQLHSDQKLGQLIKPVQTPMCPTLAKILDETIPMEHSHAALLRKKRAAKRAGQRHSDVHDSLDPFDEADDIEQSLTASYQNLTPKEQGAYKILQPIFGVHYRTLVGKLLYLARFTRPDIATAVSILSRYVSCPGYHAMAAIKQLCRYLKGTPRHGIKYTEPPNGKKLEVRFYADSNYPVGRARLGYVALIGYTDDHGEFHGRALDWHSRLSHTTSTSTAEAELYAAYGAFTRCLSLKKDLDHAGVTKPKDPCRCFEDNKAVFHQFNSPLLRTSLTWIENKYLRSLELVASGDITVEHIASKLNIADVMTKGTLSQVDFIAFRRTLMGM